ncbi:MAG: carboxypeptidase regulatory-like domain-containing protein, partial [Myxococcota bacterium]|nr:carboxypeptidase regulatory-like domain-containing protein [Myxococcota bacterium]
MTGPLPGLGLLAALSAPLEAEASETGMVVGVVFDASSGMPLAEAELQLGEARLRTDGFGAFALTAASGVQQLSVGLPGSALQDAGPVPVVRGETTEVLITIDPVAGLSTLVVESAAEPAEPLNLEDAALAALDGMVVDESGAPLSGARIYVRGWSGEGRSDDGGRFAIEVPVGTVALSVLRSGYAARSIDGIEVTVSGVSGLQIELVEAGMALDEFRVTVPRLEGGESTLLAERQDASEVVDSLSAEQMARRGDSSAAAALRRVTGLTVVGGKYVYVRGLGERYSASLFNGSTLPSPEPSRRVVPLDLFPTAMLESVLIQKTYSASMPGEFGGGVVRLRTKGVPEAPLLRVSMSGRYQAGTTFSDAWTGDRGNGDWLGFGAAHRALPDDLASATENTPLQLRSSLPGSQGFTSEELEALGEALPNRWGLQRTTALPDMALSAVAGRGWDVGEDSRVGVIFGTNYRNGWDHFRYESVVYTLDGADLTPDKSYSFAELTNTVGLSGILHVAADLGDDHHLSSTTTLTRDSENYALRGYGYEDDIGTDTRRERTQWIERQLLVQQLAGEHTLASVQ